MEIPNFKSVMPMVVESSGRGERAYDIYSLAIPRAHHLCWYSN